MCRGNPKRTGSITIINSSITNYFNNSVVSFLPNIFYLKALSNILFPPTFRMHGNSRIPHFGFWTSGGNGNRKIFVIFKCIQFTRTFHIDKFIVTAGGLSFYRPVHHTIPTINQSVIIHFFKYTPYGFITNIIQGIRLSLPIE